MPILSWTEVEQALSRDQCLVAEVRFRHTSSDWYLLQSRPALEALRQRITAPGPAAPVFLWSTAQIQREARAALTAPVAAAVPELRRLGEHMTLLVMHRDPEGAQQWWLACDDEELQGCVAELERSSGTVAAWGGEGIRKVKPTLHGDAPSAFPQAGES